MKNTRKKFFKQRLIGATLLALSVMVIIITSTAQERIGSDIGAVLFFAPLGLYLLFTKHIVLD